MKPKAFGSGNMAPKFGASKPPGKKPMLGSRRMAEGGPSPEPEPEPKGPSKPSSREGDFTRMPDYGAEAQEKIDAGRAVIPSGRRATGGGIKRMAAGGPLSEEGESTDYMRSMREPAASPPTRRAPRAPRAPRGPSAGESEADRLMDLYNRPGGVSQEQIRQTRDEIMAARAAGTMKHGGKVKKMAFGSQVTAPPKPSPDDERNMFAPGARAKLARDNKRRLQLGIPEDLNIKKGGKVSKPWEGSKADMAQDRKLAEKQNMSMDKVEKSAMDKKADAKGLNYGGKVKKMAYGGKVKKMAMGGLPSGAMAGRPMMPPQTMASDPAPGTRPMGGGAPPSYLSGLGYTPTNTYGGTPMDPNVRLAPMKHGGKVKKMADGGSAGEMQAFMKGRRDARSFMAPKAPMAPKASMAPKAAMSPKARMASKAPMAPKASMPFMKSGGAVKSKSRGNGCAARGHTRGRMV